MNAFRTEYRAFTGAELELLNNIRAAAQELHDRIDMIHPGRERDFAKARLEECFMWAGKAIAAAR